MVTSEFHSATRSVLGGPVVEVHTGPVSFEASFIRRVLHATTEYQALTTEHRDQPHLHSEFGRFRLWRSAGSGNVSGRLRGDP